MNSLRIPLSRSQNDLYNTQDNVQDEGGADEIYDDELRATDDPTNAVMANRIPEDTGREEVLSQSRERKPSDRTTVNSYLRDSSSSHGQSHADTSPSSSRGTQKPSNKTVGSTLRNVESAQGLGLPDTSATMPRGNLQPKRLVQQEVDRDVSANPANTGNINMGSEEEAKFPVARKYGPIQLPPEVRGRDYKYALCLLGVITDTDIWHSLARGEWEFPRPPRRVGVVYDEIDYGDVWRQLASRTFDVGRGDVVEILEWILDLPGDVRRLVKKVAFKPSSMDLSPLSRQLPNAEVDLYLQQAGAANFPVPKRYEMLHTFELQALEKVWQEKYEFLARWIILRTSRLILPKCSVGIAAALLTRLRCQPCGGLGCME